MSEHTGMPGGQPGGVAAFGIKEMWTMSQRSDQYWGLAGYEVPKHDFDHIKHAKETENMLYVSGAKKRPKIGQVDSKAQRGGIYKEIEKRSNSVPGPWAYDTAPPWLQGYRGGVIKEPVAANAQKVAFAWRDVPKDQRQIEKAERRRSAKPDMTTKKFTYIDQIVLENTKERYPRPGPADHFLDDKEIGKFHAANQDLFSKKVERSTQKKSSLP